MSKPCFRDGELTDAYVVESRDGFHVAHERFDRYADQNGAWVEELLEDEVLSLAEAEALAAFINAECSLPVRDTAGVKALLRAVLAPPPLPELLRTEAHP
jgi:hypothetical protein